MRYSTVLVALFGLGVLSACADRQPETPAEIPREAVLDQVQPEEAVLATVDGSRIGEIDLSINLSRTLGDGSIQAIAPGIEEKILQSMVASRAIALKAIDELEADELVALEKRVALFREEILVKGYLVNHGDPESITAQQIEHYYQENPEEFAGQQERLYEVITVDPAAYKLDTQAAIQLVSRGKTHDDWQQLVRKSSADEGVLRLTHSFQTLTGEAANSAIDSAALSLQEGQISRIVMSDGAPYLVRLLKSTQQERIPLEQARAEIRRKLLPARVRQSVRAIADNILDQSDVVVAASAE